MRFLDDWTNARIDLTEDLTPTIQLFVIDAGHHTRPWTPGSHIRVGVMVQGRQEIRTYSLVDTGEQDRRYRIAVKLFDDGLGGSRYMWVLRAGASITISQPHNHFEISRYVAAYTLLAGGIGITPLVSIAHALHAGDKPVRLIYGVRSRQEAAFADLLRSWLGDRLDLRIAEETGPLDIEQIVNRCLRQENSMCAGR